MDKDIEELLEGIIDEDLEQNPMTNQEALFEIVMMLVKSQAEQMKLLQEYAKALKDSNDLVRKLDIRLTTLELSVYPMLENKGGIAQC